MVYGWKLKEHEWVPVMTNQLPAPDAIIHQVKCGCAKCSKNQCHCQKTGLNCTNLCSCCDTEDECMNHEDELGCDDDDDEDDNTVDGSVDEDDDDYDRYMSID